MKRRLHTFTRDEFNDALRRVAVPGDTIVYYTGFLWADRTKGWSKLTIKARRTLNEIARAAWEAYVDGEVALVQFRLSATDVCEYRAVKL